MWGTCAKSSMWDNYNIFNYLISSWLVTKIISRIRCGPQPSCWITCHKQPTQNSSQKLVKNQTPAFQCSMNLCKSSSLWLTLYYILQQDSSVAIVLQGPSPPHAGGFIILFRHLLGLRWRSDRSIAEACTYTWQHGTEIRRQTSLSGIRTHGLSVQASKAYASDRADTGTGYRSPQDYSMFVTLFRNNARNMNETRAKDILLTFLVVQNYLLGWWRQHVPLKRRLTIILHGSTSQKTILNFILAAVRTWNLTRFLWC
jgi:hypothetical protein